MRLFSEWTKTAGTTLPQGAFFIFARFKLHLRYKFTLSSAVAFQARHSLSVHLKLLKKPPHFTAIGRKRFAVIFPQKLLLNNSLPEKD